MMDSNKQPEIMQCLSCIELESIINDIDFSTNDGFKLPFSQLSSLGVGFAEMGDAFRSTMQQHGGETLYRAILPEGAQLRRGKDGLFSSSARLANGDPAWAKFERVHPEVQSGAVSINPATLATAIAIAQISEKLDAIQEAQRDMFDYMRQKDKSVLLGNLRTLADLYNDYHSNWDNDRWLNSAHMKAFDIKQESDQSVEHLRMQLAGKLQKRGPFDMRVSVERRLNEVLDLLKDYQLTLHVFAFASFLEPVLSANFDKEYLSGVVENISERALRYREVYTACYEEIEHESQNAVDAKLLDGVSSAGKILSKLLASSPLRDVSPIDETVSDAAKNVDKLNDSLTDDLMLKLRTAKSPDVLPFQQALESINALYNRPGQIVVDSENVYLLPEA